MDSKYKDLDNTAASPNLDQNDFGHPNQDLAPADKKNICFLIFNLFGIGILLPWNSVLTAMPYFIA